MDVATSFDGALGAGVGVVLGPYIAAQMKVSSKNLPYAAAAGAVAVPALVSMQLDAPVLAIAAGAFVGVYAYINWSG
jgi:hypothetical protein